MIPTLHQGLKKLGERETGDLPSDLRHFLFETSETSQKGFVVVFHNYIQAARVVCSRVVVHTTSAASPREFKRAMDNYDLGPAYRMGFPGRGHDPTFTMFLRDHMFLRAHPIIYTLLPALLLAYNAGWVFHKHVGGPPVMGWFLAINFVTYVVWWADKRQARRRGFRVPDWTLHLLSLLGGVLAAVYAMLTLRHKTQKYIFCIGHPLWVVLAVCLSFSVHTKG